MKLQVKNGRVLINGDFVKTDLYISSGKISLKRPVDASKYEQIDAGGNYVLPGFIDVHTHGGAGVDINNASVKDLKKVSEYFASNGTTSWLASIVTDTKEKTLESIDNITKAMESGELAAEILGIHLEGPFLSNEYRGSMSEELLKKSEIALFEEYKDAAGGYVKYITIAPELEGSIEIIKRARQEGISVALGHTGADYETAMEAIDEGANSCTHTFNGIKLLHQHRPGVLGAVLESDIYAEAICDGIHLHPGIVRLLIKTKGLDKVIAVTDSIMASGLNDGIYNIGVNQVVVKNGDSTLLSTGMRAGSTLTTIKAFKNLLDFTGKSIDEIIPLLTENPANMLGVFEHKGSIDHGKDADIIILDEKLNVHVTIVGGKIVWQKE